MDLRKQLFVSLAGIFLGISLGLTGFSQGEAETVYDLLLKNGHVIDPSTGRNERTDIAVAGERIVRIAPDLPAHRARTVVDVGGYYVTPGLIDLHAYVNSQAVFRQGDPRTHRRNVNPDHNALRHGVTTVVDGGSTGWKNFESFKELVIDASRARVLAFLNILADGMVEGETVADPARLELERAVETARRHPEIIVGIRSPHLKGTGREGVRTGIRAAESIGAKALVEYLGEEDLSYRDLVLREMRPGDLITHTFGLSSPFAGAGGNLDATAEEARRRGVLFDLGHGSHGFWFRVAFSAVRAGFLPDVLSTAMDKTSLLLPRAEMMTTLSKFLNMGVPIEELLERVTVRPARALNRPDLARLVEGGVADVAVIELKEGRFGFLDSGHGRLKGDRRLEAVLTIREGRVVWDSKGLSRTDWSVAGPYSNYR